MKYIITENKFIGLINNYLQTSYPQVFDLTKIKMRVEIFGSVHMPGYKFLDETDKISYFCFLLEDPFETTPEEDFPQLQVEHHLYQDVVSMFGEDGVEYLIEWFEKQYGLKANTITI